jgi:hypothetical protein
MLVPGKAMARSNGQNLHDCRCATHSPRHNWRVNSVIPLVTAMEISEKLVDSYPKIYHVYMSFLLLPVLIKSNLYAIQRVCTCSAVPPCHSCARGESKKSSTKGSRRIYLQPACNNPLQPCAHQTLPSRCAATGHIITA